MEATMVEERILSTREAAELLHKSIATLHNWLSENQLGIRKVAYKVGGQWLFFYDELIDWIRQHPGEKSDEDAP